MQKLWINTANKNKNNKNSKYFQASVFIVTLNIFLIIKMYTYNIIILSRFFLNFSFNVTLSRKYRIYIFLFQRVNLLLSKFHFIVPELLFYSSVFFSRVESDIYWLKALFAEVHNIFKKDVQIYILKNGKVRWIILCLCSIARVF